MEVMKCLLPLCIVLSVVVRTTEAGLVTSAASSCSNDATWVKSGSNGYKDCDWVAKKSAKRCSKKSADNVVASDACVEACGCPPTMAPTAATVCEDDASWYKGNKPEKDCTWVSKNTDVRCGWTSSQNCPASCGSCNKCAGTKVDLPNIKCTIDGMVNPSFALGTGEQSGVNVTKGYQGDYETSATPITGAYADSGLCPVNVHWHLGTEHYSKGQYDEYGTGPSSDRRLSGEARSGYQCRYYDETDSKFTTEYDWQYCVDMQVGETYEIHWPHSNMGACGTDYQYQTPFYDGVFCTFATDFGGSLADAKIGVQSQTFTIVNDEDYYNSELLSGMVIDGEMGTDIATYTGSTTGTSRNDQTCSQYAGITWQVDRKCHLMSASSFDQLCADMADQEDDMSDDYYPHGSRKLVNDTFAANNQQRLRVRKLGSKPHEPKSAQK